MRRWKAGSCGACEGFRTCSGGFHWLFPSIPKARQEKKDIRISKDRALLPKPYSFAHVPFKNLDANALMGLKVFRDISYSAVPYESEYVLEVCYGL